MTPQALQAALASDKFSEADKCAIRWQYGLYGGFFEKLFRAIAHADTFNQEKLALGFPDEVAGYRSWSEGDLFQRLEDFDNEYRAQQV